MKLSNEYAAKLGIAFDDMPKAVLAAVAVSFAARIFGEDSVLGPGVEVLREWRVLHAAGIVPQAPPRRLLDDVGL